MRTLLNESISVSNMREPDISLSKRTGLDFSKAYLLNSPKKLFKNLTHIWEKYLIWMRVDTGNRLVFVPSRAMRNNRMRNPIAAFNHLNLKAMRNERLRVYGNIGHRQRLRRGGDQS